ncbi:MAG: competence/damage-inducible protein A [Bacteroidetes bacterium]|nr:competence/damage-inducible protein A [Bacteroidota bacterium]
MSVEVVVIGDEIVLGLITDTNSSHICRRLVEYGQEVVRITKVGDSLSTIVSALEAASSSDVVITCGGLGPTHDDMTREAVARYLGTPLQLDSKALHEIESMYSKAGRVMSEANKVQAMIPLGASYLSNQKGTAPGLKFTKNRTTYFCLQGVPKEMEWMLETHVVPFVSQFDRSSAILHRTIRTVGSPESVLFEKTKPVIDRFRSNLSIAFLPQMTRGVDIRLTSRLHEEKQALEIIQSAEAAFVSAIDGSFRAGVYGFDNDRLEDVTARLLFGSKKTVATAESCTGGLIAHRFTNVAGSSSYFIEGVVAYSNEAKIRDVGVPAELIEMYGAVSKEVAVAMAENMRTRAGTDIGLATTGIAGPGGGTDAKPVGLAFVALATKEHSIVKQITPLPFGIDRLSFKERLSTFAIDLVRKHLMDIRS